MWEASAPSNIALIKYMGKKTGGNIAVNSSLSWTLEHLRTFVQIEPLKGAEKDRWEPLNPGFVLSTLGTEKFLKHFHFLKDKFGAKGSYLIRSGNNFPADCGIASSASSFAALTRCAAAAFSTTAAFSDEELADLSRQGSGSSCRSLLPGWVAWEAKGVNRVHSPLNELIHAVALVSDSKKTVTSSEAHKKVATSLLMQGRAERAEKRFTELVKELKSVTPSWRRLFELTWADFWDMHALFETSSPPFGYMAEGSLKILNEAASLWTLEGEGPLVTMDAGPNVHLMWRPDQKNQADEFLRAHSNVRFLSNWVEV